MLSDLMGIKLDRENIPGGGANLDTLNSALGELNMDKLRYLTVEIEDRGYLRVILSKLARCLVSA